MILVLSDECPIFTREAEPYLSDLLHTLTIKRRHVLASPAPKRLQELLPDHLWNLYGTYLTQAAKQSAYSYQRWTHNADCSTCNAEKLALFCDLPTLLIVENAHTDGGWIKFIVRKLRPRLAAHMSPPYFSLEIHHAGGIGEIPKELERTAERYQQARPSNSLPLRLVALADSDAPAPGDMSANARHVVTAAERFGATAHILNKRAIENYIPDNSLHEYALTRSDRRAAVNFVTALTGAARDHYPLKDGLTEEELDAAGSMYPAGTPLGLKVGDFILDFLRHFGAAVEPGDLTRRDGSGELDALLDLLEANL